MALWIKTLLVHGASWSREAADLATRVIASGRNERSLRDEVTALLGYGQVVPARVLACSPERATLLATGSLGPGQTKLHTIPLPPSLQAHARWRRLVITLAWFTPIRPSHRKYRAARIFFQPPGTGNMLVVGRTDADWRAVLRGTVQHEVLDADRGAINFPLGGALEIPVTCVTEAGGFDGEIEYTMAVTLEVAEGVNTRIYDEIRASLRVPLPVRPPAR